MIDEETLYERAKAYDDMSDEDRAFAIHSARYILDGVSVEKMAEVSGLPEGVIAAAFENIFIDRDTLRPTGQCRPKRQRPQRRK